MAHENTMHKKKRTIIIILAILLILSILIPTYVYIKNQEKTTENQQANLSCPECNVIFLNIELLRADYIGLISNEYGKSSTPNIDKFFKNGIIFTDASAAAGATAYSNMATLTAQDGSIVRTMFGNTSTLEKLSISEENARRMNIDKSVAEILYSNGYYTLNLDIGYHSGQIAFLDRGFTYYTENSTFSDENNKIIRDRYKKTLYLIKQFLPDKKSFLLTHTAELNGNLAFKLPLNTTKINNSKINYLYDNRTQSYWISYQIHKNGSLIPPINNTDVIITLDLLPDDNKVTWMNDSMYKEYRGIASAVYSQEVEYVDYQLGEIFAYLENSSLINNTIIVLYANHGEGLYNNYIRSHGTSYQSNIHVPILIRHPKIREQIKITEPVALIDLVPTIYDMLKINTTEKMEGISLTTLITNNTYKREYIFGANTQDRYVRHKDMKLIIQGDGKKELYNITSDPHEETNLISKYPEMTQLLSYVIDDHEIKQARLAWAKFENNTKRK